MRAAGGTATKAWLKLSPPLGLGTVVTPASGRAGLNNHQLDFVNFSASYSDSESSQIREGRQERAAGVSVLAPLVVSLIDKT